MKVKQRLVCLIIAVLTLSTDGEVEAKRRGKRHCIVQEQLNERKNNNTVVLPLRGGGAGGIPNVLLSKQNYTFPLLSTGKDTVPARYIKMTKGNRKKAKAAFESTLKWRQEHDVDTILSRSYPNLMLYRELVPHGFLGRDPTGHVIFCLRCGYLDFDLMKKYSVSHDQLVMHYVYVLEYLWNILEPAPDATMTFVLDLSGVSLNKIRKSVGFVKQFCATIDQHYPQRSHKTLIINVPKWFGVIYRAISPLLREATRQMIELYSKGEQQTEALKMYMGEENIPKDLMKGSKPTAKLGSSIQDDFEEFVSSVAKPKKMCAVPRLYLNSFAFACFFPHRVERGRKKPGESLLTYNSHDGRVYATLFYR